MYSKQFVVPGDSERGAWRPRQRRLRSGAAITVALALVQAACLLDERYPYFIEPGSEGAPGVERALLLPVDFPEGLGGYLPGSAARLQALPFADLCRDCQETIERAAQEERELRAGARMAQELR